MKANNLSISNIAKGHIFGFLITQTINVTTPYLFAYQMKVSNPSNTFLAKGTVWTPNDL